MTLALGLFVLIASTVIVGYGNYLAGCSKPAAARFDASSHPNSK